MLCLKFAVLLSSCARVARKRGPSSGSLSASSGMRREVPEVLETERVRGRPVLRFGDDGAAGLDGSMRVTSEVEGARLRVRMKGCGRGGEELMQISVEGVLREGMKREGSGEWAPLLDLAIWDCMYYERIISPYPNLDAN